jgi:hypothetical protein
MAQAGITTAIRELMSRGRRLRHKPGAGGAPNSSPPSPVTPIRSTPGTGRFKPRRSPGNGVCSAACLPTAIIADCARISG